MEFVFLGSAEGGWRWAGNGSEEQDFNVISFAEWQIKKMLLFVVLAFAL